MPLIIRPPEYRLLDDGTWGIAVWDAEDHVHRRISIPDVGGRVTVRLTRLIRAFRPSIPGRLCRPALYRYEHVLVETGPTRADPQAYLPANSNAVPRQVDPLMEDEADEWMVQNGHSLVG